MSHGPTSGHAMHIKDVQTQGMVAQVETRALSTARAKDIEAARSSEAVAKKLRRDALLAVLLFSALLVCFLLFFLLL